VGGKKREEGEGGILVVHKLGGEKEKEQGNVGGNAGDKEARYQTTWLPERICRGGKKWKKPAGIGGVGGKVEDARMKPRRNLDSGEKQPNKKPIREGAMPGAHGGRLRITVSRQCVRIRLTGERKQSVTIMP